MTGFMAFINSEQGIDLLRLLVLLAALVWVIFGGRLLNRHRQREDDRDDGG